MLNKVIGYVRSNQLLESDGLYIVALSGGADSVALLLLLQEAGYRIEAAHCNFHLRGSESDRDEAFCERLCAERNIPFHRVHFETKTYAELHRVSIEMAARELRYGWFEQLRRDIGADGICVAHHRDDSVETVLMNIVRGTGLRGLTGIHPRNGFVLRPLLCVSRMEIEQFLQQRSQLYVTDSTNLETDVLRNKIRLQLVPLLKQLNPAVVENVQRMSENLIGAQELIQDLLSLSKSGNELIISRFVSCHSRKYAAFEWLKKYGFNGRQVRQILDAEVGRIVTSSLGYEVLRDRERLIVEPVLKPMKPLIIPEEGTYLFDEGNCKIAVSKKAAYVSRLPTTATVDASKVAFPLTVRRVEKGEWMIPYGMSGRRLVSDMMTDMKMTVFEKRRQLVVADAKKNIIWMVGRRVDGRFAVDQQSRYVLELSM